MDRLRALARVFGSWGPPPDAPAWAALGVAAVALVIACAPERAVLRVVGRVSPRAFAGVCAFAAAVLSLGYVAFYLRGAPRIVDATTYFLQGRALSEGHFAWHVPEPTASFRGRFLVADGHGAIAGIFPPGYPLLLSLGFALGAPMVVGPALAAALVVATWSLARGLAEDLGAGPERRESIARLAAVLSIASAALRYHTADTMAHGACALAFVIAIDAGLRARRERPWMMLVAGLALGFVASTRFASALALGAALVWIAGTQPGNRRGRASALVGLALGVLPGLALLAIAQRSAAGSALVATQSVYYANSDGPPGCFRYGFGAGVGCLFEHGDFVRARLPGGYGLLAALGTTARRLAHHLGDVANFEPLALLVLVPLASRKARERSPGALPDGARGAFSVRACLALVALQIAAYVPFYFDGDYPGGGARFFADVLPVEHALLAVAAAQLADRARVHVRRSGALLVALACAGFALHAAYAHEELRARDGGHPMFDAETLTRAHLAALSALAPGGRAPLVFVDTDLGFALAHDPAAAVSAARGEPAGGPIVARLRGDDHDRLLYDHLGRPPAFQYRFKPRGAATLADLAAPSPELVDSLDAWSPQPTWGGGADSWRFETESEWPPLAQRGGAWAEPIWATDTCASPLSQGRALLVRTTGDAGEVVVALPIPHAGEWAVTPRIMVRGELPPGATLVAGDPPLATWEVPPQALPGALSGDRGGAPLPPDGVPIARCVDLPSHTVSAAGAREIPVTLHLPPRSAVSLDRLNLSLVPPHPG